jgi:hypothetical protein
LRHRTRLHHIGVGHAHKGKRVIMLVDGLDVRVVSQDGELLRQFTLDPTRDYQPRAGGAYDAPTQPATMRCFITVVEVGGIDPPSPGDLSGLLRAQPVGRSRLEAPTGGGPLGQPGFDVRRRPPGGAVAVSLLTTPILPSQATGRGRLPSYLGSERVIVIGACIGPGF